MSIIVDKLSVFFCLLPGCDPQMTIKKSNTEARGSVLSRETDRARETRTNLLEWRSSARGFHKG